MNKANQSTAALDVPKMMEAAHDFKLSALGKVCVLLHTRNRVAAHYFETAGFKDSSISYLESQVSDINKEIIETLGLITI